MRLSIIVPVYNVEAYIEKCLQSLLEQNIPKDEYEIIVINDGSPDNSRLVVIKLIEEYPNIILIDQENKGVSLARNAGMDRARGNYLLFIDPDDYVEKNSFSQLLRAAEKENAQLTFLGFTFLNEDNSIQKKIFFSKQNIKYYTGINSYYISGGDGKTDPDRSWAILYDMRFINTNKLRFAPGIPFLEDGEFIARVFCLAEKCIFFENNFYFRTTRPGSATNSRLLYTEKSRNGFFIAINNLRNFRNTTVLNTNQDYFINQAVTKFSILIVLTTVENWDYKKYTDIKKRLKSNNLNKLPIKGCSRFYYKCGFLYNLSINIFAAFWITHLISISIKRRLLFLKKSKKMPGMIEYRNESAIKKYKIKNIA